MGCLWCGKYSRQCNTMPSRPPEFIPPFIPVTGMKCSYGKISSPLTEISVGKTEISETEPARPLIWTHRKFYKGFRGEARSRKSGQPGQPGSYEEALRFASTIQGEISRCARAVTIKKCTKQACCTCRVAVLQINLPLVWLFPVRTALVLDWAMRRHILAMQLFLQIPVGSTERVYFDCNRPPKVGTACMFSY